MLTKGKTHRIMLLVQYKSSVRLTSRDIDSTLFLLFISSLLIIRIGQAILKRALKVSHPVMELYVLKVLKSQVPYLGRKWRSGK